MDLVVHDLRHNKIVKDEGIVIRKRLQLMLYNIMYRMMFDAKFESQDDPLFIEATRFNSERSRLAQSFDYNYGDFIPLLRPFLRGYLNKCRDLQNRRLAFSTNIMLRKEGTSYVFSYTCLPTILFCYKSYYTWYYNIYIIVVCLNYAHVVVIYLKCDLGQLYKYCSSRCNKILRLARWFSVGK